MKTSYNLTLIGTVLAMFALSLPFIISETSPKPEIPNTFDHQLIDTLVEFGCSELAIYHLMDYSNLLDEEYDGVYVLEWISLPHGLSEEDFDKCVQIAISIRESNATTGSERLQRVLDHCESQRKFAAGEIPERNADGSFNAIDLPGLSYQNGTHFIDNNTCEWMLK